MIDIRIIDSLEQIGREEWNACFSGELEDYDYLLSIETSGMKGFTWQYVIAEESGQILAAMPAFLTDYAIDTTLDGGAKKVTSMLRNLLPGMLTLKLACLGSPCTECGIIGFHPTLSAEEHAGLLRRIVEAFEAHAIRKGANTIGLKDIPQQHESLWKEAMQGADFRSIPGLPVATLPIDFSDIESYIARLSYSARKDMRRKLKSRDQLRIEHCESLNPKVLARVMELYHGTRSRAEMQFEELTPEFFQNTLCNMPGRAFFTLYYAGDELLAANLLLRDGTKLLDKFFCMDSERGRALNLYFVSWFTNINYCLAHGLKHYQSGQACYENKVRLLSKLVRTSMFFKHRNRLIHSALKLAAPLLAVDYIEEVA